MIYHFDELTSTIDEARYEKYTHGDVVVAESQTAGRGQRGRVWSSTPGENLTFSVVLDTSFLRADEQFLLLQTVALALTDLFAGYGLDARIKWTNDIYIGDRKIVGVLIDHSMGPGGMLVRSGVGIGINVNQRVFEDWLPNPTSMALEAGRELSPSQYAFTACCYGRRPIVETFDRREVLERFYYLLMARFEALKYGAREVLQCDYHSRIYRLDTLAQYILSDGTRFNATIRGVGPGGELLLETPVGVKKYLYREVTFII